MKRKRLVIVFLVGFYAGLLVRAGRSTAQSLPAYAISVDTVMQRLQEHQDLFLVDVREARQFAQVRIPGSLNIPLFAVKTKSFLKTKPVVLVDEGYRPYHLEETCEQLTQAGFEAHFLFGGLNAWRMWSAPRRWASPSGWRPSGSMPTTRTLLPLHGDVFAQKALNTMPPRAVFAEQEGKYWLLIDVSASGEARSPGSAGVSPALPGGGLFSQARSVPFDRDNSDQFLAGVEFAVAQASTRSEGVLVLIANQHGENYEAIARVVRNTRIAPVFFLEGGFDAYTRFVTQQHQIRQGQPQNVTTSCQPCAR